MASLETILPTAARAPAVYNGVTQFAPVKYLLKNVAGFVDGPTISKKQLRHSDIKIADMDTVKAMSADELENTVVIVQDAFTSYFEAPLIIDLVSALRKLGFNPMLAPYSANGKPLHVHGFLGAFKRTAERNSKLLKQYNDAGVALIGVDPSMTLTYRSEYAKYVDEADLPQVQLLQEWLIQHKDKLAAFGKENSDERSFTLLPHCTEKTNASSSVGEWQQVFGELGVTLKTKALGCCGMAGTYGHETRNLETSKTIYEQSWKPAISEAEDTTQLLATGYSCRCQVKRFSDVKIQHPVQVLLEVLGINNHY